MPTPVHKEPKACLIGDSISSKIDRRVLEKVLQTEVRTVRAYSSLDDITENEAKEKTRFPNKSFAEVIEGEMKNSPSEILIVQSGSVDITNMKTNEANIQKYAEYFKQQTVMSATNLFTAVTNSLISHHGIQKAIIMKQIPRYDPRSSDPHSVKAALSQLYNDTLVQLWLGSPHKNRIMIGSHSLECTGGIRDARYKNKDQYDGIHMYGPAGRKAYTESVLSIIRDVGLVRTSPPRYFRYYHMKSGNQTKPSTQEEYNCPTQDTDWQNDTDIRKKKVFVNKKGTSQYSIPTSNRFTGFNQH